LKKFNFKSSFSGEKDKDVYIRQIEEMIRQYEKKNNEMAIIITGIKREINEDNNSVSSQIYDLPNEGRDFF
jgi:hypothetical protein